MASAAEQATNRTAGPSPPNNRIRIGANGLKVSAICLVLRRLRSSISGTNGTGGCPNRANTR